MSKSGPDYTIKSVEKALGILGLFSPDRPQLTLNEIKDIVGMPKATVFRILYTLEKAGLVRRDGESGAYRLGLKLVYLGNLVALKYDLTRISRPVMSALRDETGETVDCTILDNDQVLYIDLLESTHRLKAESSQVGRKLPLHCTACGKVLAAFSPPDKLPSCWPPALLPAFTKKTITDPRILEKELRKVRERGYAVDRGELDEGIYAVSAPILDSRGTAIAALTIVAPADRLDKGRLDAFIDRVRQGAGEITKRIRKLL